MSFEAARKVADAVLFEGYVLYPYRASAPKNQLRWQFGVLAPPRADPGETTFAQTECLLEPGEMPALDLRVRFLQVRTRGGDPPWDEGMVREIDAHTVLGSEAEQRIPFELPGDGEDTPADAGGDRPGGGRSWALSGLIRVATRPVPGPRELLRLRVRVENHTGWAGGPRTEMLRRSMIATHTLLVVQDGGFLSLLDPPDWAVDAASGCENLFTWPALIGEDTVLSSPIILYDQPETAPESTADLCDATEMDELLVLRTMTLTDEEKRQARATDPRAAAIVDHADTMPPEIFERLHGAIRSVRPAAAESRPVPPAGILAETRGESGTGTVADTRGDEHTGVRTEPFGETPMEPWRDPGAGSGADAHSGVRAESSWEAPSAPRRDLGAGTGPDEHTDVRAESFCEAPSAPWWDPGADRSVCPESDGVEVAGGIACRGVRVRIRPGLRRTDAADMFLHGRGATVAAVLRDVDGGTHLAVTIDDDPGADLKASVGRFLYFAPDEVELR